MEARLCGLAVSIATQGRLEACAEFHAALAPHTSGFAAFAQDSLQLSLRLLAQDQTEPEPLSIRRVGQEFFVHGNGVAGELGERAARLDVYGGRPVKLHTALRLACALWLAPRQGLLLHGACVERQGRALAFLGPSGAGKTTLARRMEEQGVHVLADEVVAVRALPDSTKSASQGSSRRDAQGAPSRASIRVFGHSLNGKVGDGRAPAEGLPLAAIGLISHAREGLAASPRRLSPPEAGRALLQRIFLPAADTALLEQAMETIGAIARETPVFTLPLFNDARAAQAALALLEVA